MKFPRDFFLSVALLLAAAGSTAVAADLPANVAGTWKITITHDGKTDAYQPILKLKADREKLTGTITRNTGTKIETLSVEGGQLKNTGVSFAIQFYSQVYQNGVLQPPDTNQMSHWKFQGTIGDGLMKGTVEKNSSAGSRTQNWEARRVGE